MTTLPLEFVYTFNGFMKAARAIERVTDTLSVVTPMNEFINPSWRYIINVTTPETSFDIDEVISEHTFEKPIEEIPIEQHYASDSEDVVADRS